MKYKSFEDFLMEKHAEQYAGLDDEMPDDYADWLACLSVDELIRYGDAYAKTTACNAHEDLCRDLKSANDFIRRAMQILTPDQVGFCGFYRPNDEALAKAGVKV